MYRASATRCIVEEYGGTHHTPLGSKPESAVRGISRPALDKGARKGVEDNIWDREGWMFGNYRYYEFVEGLRPSGVKRWLLLCLES